MILGLENSPRPRAEGHIALSLSMSSVDSSWLDSSECRCTANDDDGEKAIAVNENKDDRVLKLCV